MWLYSDLSLKNRILDIRKWVWLTLSKKHELRIGFIGGIQGSKGFVLYLL